MSYQLQYFFYDLKCTGATARLMVSSMPALPEKCQFQMSRPALPCNLEYFHGHGPGPAGQTGRPVRARVSQCSST